LSDEIILFHLTTIKGLSQIKKTSDFQNALNKANIPLTVFAGQEVHLTGELMDAIAADDVLFMDATNRYLLLELPHDGIPAYTEDMIFDLTTRGITPVIAHPERNLGIQEDPDKLFNFIKMGFYQYHACHQSDAQQ